MRFPVRNRVATPGSRRAAYGRQSRVGGLSYGPTMSRKRTYTDAQLAAAIAASTSWRGVLRELGMVATSSGAMRSVRSHADSLGLRHDHFRGGRGWTEADLGRAIAHSNSWFEVAEALDLHDTSDVDAIRGHAARLNLEVGHLMPVAVGPIDQKPAPSIEHLDRAGSLLAAAWFTLSGLAVSWPLEPSRYDLVVGSAAGLRRIQVKTTTARAGNTWKVYLSTSHRRRRTYSPDEIDDFFVIDGDLRNYLIPGAVVGGLHAIHLSAYQQYLLPQIAGRPWSETRPVTAVCASPGCAG